jgi:hypothetical protein
MILLIMAGAIYYYIHYYRKDNLVVNSKPTSSLQKSRVTILKFKNMI